MRRRGLLGLLLAPLALRGTGGTPGEPSGYVPPSLPGVAAGSASQIIRARQVIVSGPGGSVLVYSPAAGAGNLVASIAAQPITDPYGNLTVPQVASYVNDSGTWVATVLAGGTFGAGITFFTAPSEAGPWTQKATLDYSPAIGGPVLAGATAVFNVTTAQLTGTAAAIPQSSAGITTVPQLVSALINVGILS